ncbi:MAG: hypothetical protein KC933_13725 [Myxococcales bacterium]|nr:hypothetical protein [Myxococcales bacterium]MCB9646697.1 hypothetical protein [Deltaproteobacteria bacterium]
MVRRAPTPPELFVDGRGRPYFLWDVEMTLESYREHLRSDDPAERAYWLARALRDAKPDDVLELVSWEEIAAAWPTAAPYVGDKRPFWRWWLERMGYEVQAE